jgi:hypothetical protein
MQKMATPLETAVRTALANPHHALAYLDKLAVDQLRAMLGGMGDVELDYLHELIERRNAEAAGGRPRFVLSADERAMLADLAERREAGEIPLDRREHRETEGCWGFLGLLRSFARQNGLPMPAIDHRLSAYQEQFIRDLFDRYGLTASTAGVPVADWSEDDQATIMEVWARVKTRG